MRKSREEIIDYINGLSGYEGFVQFSHRPIDIKRDVFIGSNPKVEEEEGFVLEAHFFNETDSVTVRQINDIWMVDESHNILLDDVATYHAIGDLKINMAQQWKPQEDDNCADMEVMKLEKVVFAGFWIDEKKGEQDDNSTL